jgi:hypothetical protein
MSVPVFFLLTSLFDLIFFFGIRDKPDCNRPDSLLPCLYALSRSGIFWRWGCYVFSYCKDSQKNPQAAASPTQEWFSSKTDIWVSTFMF